MAAAAWVRGDLRRGEGGGRLRRGCSAFDGDPGSRESACYCDPQKPQVVPRHAGGRGGAVPVFGARSSTGTMDEQTVDDPLHPAQ